MKTLLLLPSLYNWTLGWLETALWAITALVIIIFVIYKVRQGKHKKDRNQRIRNTEEEKLTKDK